PAAIRSLRTGPRSRSNTAVPGGTSIIMSSALLPEQFALEPACPESARQCLRWVMPARLSAPASARMITEPPRPPSPPSGPPLGTNFSRRKLMQPLPPSPPFMNTLARSANTGRGASGGRFGGLHADVAAALPLPELDGAVDRGEHRVVPAEA